MKQSSRVLVGEAFPLITGQTGSKRGGWRRRNSVCFPKEKLCVEQADLESQLRVPAVESPERESWAVRPTREGCPEGEQEMLMAQEGPRLVLTNPLEGSATWGV